MSNLSRERLWERAIDQIPVEEIREYVRAHSRDAIEVAYQRHLRHQDPNDHPESHEPLVAANGLRIYTGSGWKWGAEGALAVVLMAAWHDTCGVDGGRITEAEANTPEAQLARLRQRIRHLYGAAANLIEARQTYPNLMTGHMWDRVTAHAGLHDAPKMGLPYPLLGDVGNAEAVELPRFAEGASVEGDYTFPIDPIDGPHTDLRRRGVPDPSNAQLQEQARTNYQTQLVKYRASFPDMAPAQGPTFIRTPGGLLIVAEYCKHWGI